MSRTLRGSMWAGSSWRGSCSRRRRSLQVARARSTCTARTFPTPRSPSCNATATTSRPCGGPVAGTQVDLVLAASERDLRSAARDRARANQGTGRHAVRRRRVEAGGYNVYRSYDEPGGIRDELYAIAAKNPNTVKLEILGHTLQGRGSLRSRSRRTRAPSPTARGRTCSTWARSTPANGSRRRSRAASSTTSSITTTRTQMSRTSSTPVSCGSCPSRTRTATSTRSTPSGCGGRVASDECTPAESPCVRQLSRALP